MRNPLSRDRRIWVVTVKEHVISRYAGTVYRVKGREYKIGNSTEKAAKRQALDWAHLDAGVPPWKPYRREGWKHVTAIESYVGAL